MKINGFLKVHIFRYRAIYSYEPLNSDELALKEDDIVFVVEKCDDGWFIGKKILMLLNFVSLTFLRLKL